MKANLLKSVFVIVIALVSGINVFNAQKPAVLSDVAMENVEALANDECSGTGSCSGAISWGNCYNRSNDMWVCLRIKCVEYYNVTEGSILECRHDKVTECPSSTYEK